MQSKFVFSHIFMCNLFGMCSKNTAFLSLMVLLLLQTAGNINRFEKT